MRQSSTVQRIPNRMQDKKKTAFLLAWIAWSQRSFLSFTKIWCNSTLQSASPLAKFAVYFPSVHQPHSMLNAITGAWSQSTGIPMQAVSFMSIGTQPLFQTWHPHGPKHNLHPYVGKHGPCISVHCGTHVWTKPEMKFNGNNPLCDTHLKWW